MSAEWPWSELDLDGRTDVRSVKRAYAQKLKTIDRNDANVFQSLRTAFDEAKFLASATPSPKKPSMRQAANGVETVPGVVSYSFDFDDIPQASHPEPDPNPQSETPDPSKAPLDLDAEDTTAPPPTAPLTTETSTTSNPWSKPEEEPQSDADKEADFFRDLAATYETGVWKLTPLQNILERDIAMDRGVRDHAEYLLFERLREAVVEEERSISQGVAKLMEQNFGWASDGVRFNKKFGWHEGSELVAYDVARAVQSQNVKAPPRPQKTPLHAKRARIFMCLILYMGGVFVLYPDGLTAEIFLFGTFVAAVSFAIVWCFVLFLYYWSNALIGALRRIGVIDRYITRVWQASVERAAWFDRIDTVLHLPGPRSTLLFSVSCAVTLLVLISWGLSRI